jgi:hypothetical protein
MSGREDDRSKRLKESHDRRARIDEDLAQGRLLNEFEDSYLAIERGISDLRKGLVGEEAHVAQLVAEATFNLERLAEMSGFCLAAESKVSELSSSLAERVRLNEKLSLELDEAKRKGALYYANSLQFLDENKKLGFENQTDTFANQLLSATLAETEKGMVTHTRGLRITSTPTL